MNNSTVNNQQIINNMTGILYRLKLATYDDFQESMIRFMNVMWEYQGEIASNKLYVPDFSVESTTGTDIVYVSDSTTGTNITWK